jgi:hypothetical protein
VAKPYRERLEFELDVIITMKFPGYFLSSLRLSLACMRLIRAW